MKWLLILYVTMPGVSVVNSEGHVLEVESKRLKHMTIKVESEDKCHRLGQKWVNKSKMTYDLSYNCLPNT